MTAVYDLPRADWLEERAARSPAPARAFWLTQVLPDTFTAPFAPHHVELWEWVWSLEPDVRPEAFCAIWARFGAKSSSAEAAVVALGARRKRRYGWYVSSSQELADDHVGSIAAMLESQEVAWWYPDVAKRGVGKYGNSRGWRRNRLATASGFVVDALGLDTAARGVKIEEQRPDFLVIDDIDDHKDSPKATQAKIEDITRKLIPAGASDLAILAIQNLVHPSSVFAQLARGDAGFLARRRVSGPIPAIEGLVIERRREDGEPRDVIVAGRPTWAGQDVAACQGQLDDMGLRAFVAECQHDVQRTEGALWSADQIHAGRVSAHPDLVKVAVAVDPSGGDGPRNDEQGIVVSGRSRDGHRYVLEDATVKLSPAGWGKAAVDAYVRHSADVIVGEANFGGAMVKATIEGAAAEMHREGKLASPHVPVIVRTTGSRGKRVRAEPVAAMYGEVERPETWPDARVHHVGTFGELEVEMTRWTPDSKWSPNRLDALVWAVAELGGTSTAGTSASAATRGAVRRR